MPGIFSSEELTRYSRHALLPGFGTQGQARLKSSSALVVGAGGLGSPVALYLAAAGIGRLGLVDFDTVELSNLHRQIIHSTTDIDRLKVESARERIHAINPHVSVEVHPQRLTSANAMDVIGGYDIVADGADNFATRYLVNDACVLTGTPNVFASISQFEGQLSVFGARNGPCYRCLFPEPPPPGSVPSCAEGGVLGVVPGIAGTLQATEVIKVLCGIGEPLVGRLLVFDALGMQFRTLRISRDAGCAICGEHPTVTSLIDYDVFCGTPSDNQQYPDKTKMAENPPEITVSELKEMQERGNAPFLLDVRRKDEYEFANLGGTLIPLDELPERLDELDEHKDEFFVVHCRSGARSGKAVSMLRDAGFKNPVNLKGGILAWSREIDPAVPQY